MNDRKFFSKKSRLLKLDDFIFVFKQSKSITESGITLFSRWNELGYPRIGLSIAKRYVRRAHDRNRIKRCVRETFRVYQNDLLSLDFVCVVCSKEVLYLKNCNLIRELKKLWFHHRC